VVKFNITYEQAESFNYLALDVKGAYSQIPDKITQLMQLTATQNLFPAMRGPVFAIFYTDPNEVANEDEHLWAVGYSCAENVSFKDPLKLKERKASFIVKVTVFGPYDKLAEAYPEIQQRVTNDGYEIIFWSLEKYLDDPRTVKPEDLRTEIWIDVKK
jgi:effector-binding domain-containing protein